MTTNARKHKEELSSKKKNIFLQIFPLGLENGETLDESCFKFLSIFPALPSPPGSLRGRNYFQRTLKC